MRALEETAHFGPQLRQRAGEKLPARIEDDSPLCAQRIQLKAHSLSHPATDTIADDSLAQCLRSREPNMGTRGIET